MNLQQTFLITALLLVLDSGSVQAASFLSQSVFATGASIGATAPDSVTFGAGSLWVAYTNGAASDGSSGSSTVVRYSVSGAVLHQWNISGNVDGLKVDSSTGLVWALQNNDANAALTTIDPNTNATNGYSYGGSYTNSANRGFDDVVFSNGKTYLSETNPTSSSDPILLQLTTSLVSPLQVHGLLNAGSITDPDSLKLTPNGDLALTGEADQSIVFIKNPGAGNQSVSILPLLGIGAGKPDDTIFATDTAGLIIYADTGANKVYKVVAKDLAPGSVFIDVGNEFGSLDTGTGVVTPIFTGISPHGADFVTFQAAGVPEPASLFTLLGGLLFLSVEKWRRKQHHRV
jgi:hypothetical protein